MSYATLAPLGAAVGRALAVLSFRLVLPLRGAWAAEVELDALDEETPALGSCAVLVIGDRSWAGYVQEVAPWQGRARLLLEAGAGGMRGGVPSQGYQGELLSSIVADIVADAGELLAADVDSDAVLELYERAAAPGGVALTALLAGRDLGWRFDARGVVAVAAETWPAASEIGVLEMQPDGADGSIEVAPLLPTLAPGTTWRGRRIERVIYHLPEGKSLTARLVFERVQTPGDLRGLFEAAVRAAVRELPHVKRWPATVARQADDRLELQPDDGAIAGTPPAPVLLGLPGCAVQVSPGARVGLAFDAGEGSRPRALGWEQGTPADVLTLTAGAVPARLDATGLEVGTGAPPAQAVALAPAVASFASAAVTLSAAMATAWTAVGAYATAAGVVVPPLAPAGGVLATAAGAAAAAWTAFGSAVGALSGTFPTGFAATRMRTQ